MPEAKRLVIKNTRQILLRVCGMKWRAAIAGKRIGGKRRLEFAGGEVVEGAQAGGEFGGVQVALAVEAAEKIVGGPFSFLRIAFYATRDQVAVGIAPRPRPWHDVRDTGLGTWVTHRLATTPHTSLN